jgi:undecaprenyl-diphosphatase
MDFWQALILGVIEGITEYLPISSTGHLVVAQRLMGIGTGTASAKAAADAFAICIQGGAILAVVGLYWQRVLQMIRGVLGQDRDGFRLAMSILVGFLPAAVLGLLLNDWIEAHLFSLWPIIIAWVVGGVAILATAWWRKRNPAPGGGMELLEMTWKMAVIIGFMQCVAMWPGTSRSLMTIVGGILMGLTVRAAVEYSFLLGVLTLTAATVKKAVWKVDAVADYDQWLGGARLMWDSYGALPTVIGLVSAAVAAAIAVKWLVSYLQSHGLAIFGWYRIGVGLAVAGLVWGGLVAA